MVVLLAFACASDPPVGPPVDPATPIEASAAGPSLAALDLAARRARERAGDDFTVVVEPPYVVVGNEPAATVSARAEGTIRRVDQLLRQDFFPTTLAEPWTIWVLRDDASYRQASEALVGAPPTTPYGFANGRHRVLVMNIALGGGTLVHEMVHPYLAADHPGVPPWFNEGLASLFEQPGEVDGHLVGYPNWRLPALKHWIREGTLPSFRTLTSMGVEAFYGDTLGRNYAQARYLCYYLQERGLLHRYYAALRASADPTGFDPLRAVLGGPDMTEFQREWDQFVLAIPYDG